MKKMYLLLLSFMVILVACDNTTSTSGNSTQQSSSNTETAHPKAMSLWTNKATSSDKGLIYTASLKATSGKTSFGDPVILIISCNNGQSELAMNWGGHAPRGTKIPTQLRIGNENIISDDWRVIRETDKAYQYKPEKTLKLLVSNTELIAQTNHFQGGVVTAYFKLEGIVDAVSHIRKACHW